MPLELDDLSIRIVGNNYRGLQFINDSGVVAAEIYLDTADRLNIGGSLIVGADGGGGASSSSGGTGAVSGAPMAAPYLTLAPDSGLSAERVLTPGSGLAAVDGGPDGAYTLSVDATVVRTTRQVATDATLTGGGDLSANRTLGLNLGNANTWAALQTLGAGAAISGANTLTFGGDVSLSRSAANILTVSSGDRIQSANYVSGLSGYMVSDVLAEFENARIRGEFRTSTLVANEMQAYAGTLIITRSAGVLAANCTTAATIGGSFTVNAKDGDTGLALFAVGDILWMKTFSVTLGIGLSIFCTVTAVGSPSGGARNYTCTLNSGSTSATVYAGAAILDYGPSGSAAISISADGAIGSSANISVFGHSGTPWNGASLTTHLRLGNLNGSYGQTGDIYGVGIGDYHPTTGNYLFYDTARGFEMRAGAGSVGIDANGIRLVKGAGASAIGAIKYYDSTAFSSLLGGIYAFRDSSRGEVAQWIDTRALSVPAQVLIEALGGTPGASSQVALTVRSDPSSFGYGVSVWGAGGLTLATPNTYISTPAGYGRAVAWEAGTWSSGAFTRRAWLDNAGQVGGDTLVQAGGFGTTSALGYVRGFAGAADRTGYFEWIRPGGTRHGYMGYSVAGALDLVLENGSRLNINGGRVNTDVSNGAKIRRTGSAQAIFNATYQVLTYTTEDYDGNAYADLGTYNSRLYVPTDGLYLIQARVSFASNATGFRGLYIRALGTTYLAGKNQMAVNGDRTVIEVSCLQNLLAGEYVEAIAYQNSGGNLDVEALDHRSSTFAIARMV